MGQKHFRQNKRTKLHQRLLFFSAFFFSPLLFAFRLPPRALIFAHQPISNQLSLLEFDTATLKTQLLWSRPAGYMTPFSLDRFATIFDQDGNPVIFADDAMGDLYRVDNKNVKLVRLSTQSAAYKVHAHTIENVLITDEKNQIISLNAQGQETVIDNGSLFPSSKYGALPWLTFVNQNHLAAVTQGLALVDIDLFSTARSTIHLSAYEFSPLAKFKGKFKLDSVRGIAGAGDLLWIVLDGHGIPSNNDLNRILALIKLGSGTVLQKISIAKGSMSQPLPSINIVSFDPSTMNIVLQNGDTLIEAQKNGTHSHFMKGKFNTFGLGTLGVPLSDGHVRLLRTASTDFTDLTSNEIDLTNPLSAEAFFLLIKKENAAILRQQGKPLPDFPTKMQFTSWLRGTNELRYFFEDFYRYPDTANPNSDAHSFRGYTKELNGPLYQELVALGYTLQAGILAPQSEIAAESGADLASLFALLVRVQKAKLNCQDTLTQP